MHVSSPSCPDPSRVGRVEGTSDDSLRRGLRALVADGSYSQALSILEGGAVLMGCAKALDASTLIIGILGAIPYAAQLANPITVVLLERVRSRKKLCIAFTALARLFYVPLVAVPFLGQETAHITLLVAIAFMSVFATIGGCAWNSWVRGFVPEDRFGEVSGKRRRRANIVATGALLTGGGLVAMLGLTAYALIFALGVAAAAMSTWCLTQMPDAPLLLRERSMSMKKLFMLPLRHQNFRRVMGFLVSWNLTTGIGLPFFVVYIETDLGCSFTVVAGLTMVSYLMNAWASPYWGNLSDTFGNKAILRLCLPILLACLGGWAIVGEIPTYATLLARTVDWTIGSATPFYLMLGTFGILQIIMGVAQSGFDTCAGNIAMKLSPKDEATVYLAMNTFWSGMAGSITPVFCGYFAGRFLDSSWGILFLIAALLGTLALIPLSKIQERNERPVQGIFGEISRIVRLSWRIPILSFR